MINKVKIIFFFLVLMQALHSVEEYLGKLWAVFFPATFLSGLVSNNLKTGFIIINISLFIIGIICWLSLGRRNSSTFPSWLWIWIILESINCIGHSVWAISERTYVPGLATIPFIAFIVILLVFQYRYRGIKPQNI